MKNLSFIPKHGQQRYSTSSNKRHTISQLDPNKDPNMVIIDFSAQPLGKKPNMVFCYP